MTPRAALTRPPVDLAERIVAEPPATRSGLVPFGDFLDARLVELHRFAAVLCDSYTIGEDLTVQALVRAASDLSADIDTHVDAERAATAARTWIVRGYLSDSMRLGEPAAADVDRPVPRGAHDPVVRPGVAADDLADRFRRSSKLQRTVLLLRYSAGLTDRGIADTVGSTPDGIARYFVEVLTRLDVSGSDSPAADRMHTDANLTLLIVRLVGSGDAAGLGRRVASRLPNARRAARASITAPHTISAAATPPAVRSKPTTPTNPADRVAARSATTRPPATRSRTSGPQSRAPRTTNAPPRTAPRTTPPPLDRPAALVAPARVGRLGAFAGWVVAHARIIITAAVLIAGVTAVLGGSVVSLMTSDVGDPHSSSAQAADLVSQASGTSPNADLALLVNLPRAWPARADVVAVNGVARTLRTLDGVVQVVAPTEAASTGLISNNKRTAVITSAVSANADEDTVSRTVENAFARNKSISVGGTAAVDLDVNDRIAHDLARAEILAFPILLLLAVWIFRGVVAAFVPLLVGGLSIVVTLAALRGIVTFLTLSQYVVNLVIGLGLGLAIDYCLFMISRYREEIQLDGYGRAAAIRTVRTAGRTVLVSAATVAAALATLLLFPQEFLYSMGLGGVIVTLVAALGAVIVVPALLVLLGPRIDSLALKRWATAREKESSSVVSGRWYRISKLVMARARWVLPATLIVAALLAAPALFTKFGDVDQTSLPTSSTPRIVADRIAGEFGQGQRTDVFLAVSAGPGQTTMADQLGRSALAAAGQGAVATAAPRYVGHDVWTVSLALPGSPFSAASSAAVKRVRAVSAPAPFLVGGDAASFVDLETSVGSLLPWSLLIVAVAVLMIMFLLTGSVVLSIKTVLLNALNVAMTFGVLVFVFQYGHLESLLRFKSAGRIDLTQPILVAVIAFGLSTDYGVFLFARIKEAHDEGLDDTEAVSVGLGRSGRIISSAALLLCIAIGAFSSSSILFVKQLGVGAATAVFLDATLVRALLVPSAMQLMGRANWWAPPFLRRLYQRFGIPEAAPVSAAPASVPTS